MFCRSQGHLSGRVSVLHTRSSYTRVQHALQTGHHQDGQEEDERCRGDAGWLQVPWLLLRQLHVRQVLQAHTNGQQSAQEVPNGSK